jgi:Rrf2 family cysteine metabolism transcriptional repressor
MFSKRCRYGLRAMIDVAKHSNGTPVKRKDVAKRENIPSPYLENILIQLKKSGLINVTRGSKGGIVLARPAEQIYTNEIVETLEGSLAPTDCIVDNHNCSRTKDCEAFRLWSRVYEAERKVLDSTSLGELISVKKEEWVI